MAQFDKNSVIEAISEPSIEYNHKARVRAALRVVPANLHAEVAIAYCSHILWIATDNQAVEDKIFNETLARCASISEKNYDREAIIALHDDLFRVYHIVENYEGFLTGSLQYLVAAFDTTLRLCLYQNTGITNFWGLRGDPKAREPKIRRVSESAIHAVANYVSGQNDKSDSTKVFKQQIKKEAEWQIQHLLKLADF